MFSPDQQELYNLMVNYIIKAIKCEQLSAATLKLCFLQISHENNYIITIKKNEIIIALYSKNANTNSLFSAFLTRCINADRCIR